MLAVISPAKKLAEQGPQRALRCSTPDYLDKSARLIELLQGKSPQELARLMRLSDKLSVLNASRYQAWNAEHKPENATPALFLFQGDVYKGLAAHKLSDDQLQSGQRRLRILSGLYGLLRPLDLIKPHRLEMGTRLQSPSGDNLYKFWGRTIADGLRAQMQQLGSDCLLNLASQEYFKAVQGLPGRIVSPRFTDYKNGAYRVLGIYAKQARGRMASWVIRHGVEHPEQLAGFAEDGYQYCAAASTPDVPVFQRRVH